MLKKKKNPTVFCCTKMNLLRSNMAPISGETGASYNIGKMIEMVSLLDLWIFRMGSCQVKCHCHQEEISSSAVTATVLSNHCYGLHSDSKAMNWLCAKKKQFLLPNSNFGWQNVRFFSL